jgi:type VI secretion system protein ImpL
MKTFFTKLGGVLGRAWVWSLLLLLAGGLLIWFAGPHLAFNESQPWAATTPRLLTLCMLAFVWGLFLVFNGWQQTRRGKVAKAHDEQAKPPKPATEQDHKGLRLRFMQARRTLSQTRLYRGRSERWRKALPWYLILGPQGSGKTSLLEFSGLNLPLNPRPDKTSTPPARTVDCEWYFTEQGVVLDTCGRYLSQSDDTAISGWNTLLKLIGRYRRSEPLNGVLINLPTGLLLAQEQKPLEELADKVRSRLEDIHRRLHCQTPVYLVLSKADEIRGFDCFYADIGPPQSQQPLGVSFSATDSLDAKLIQLKVDELLGHVSNQVINRVRDEIQAKRVARVVDFPRQLAMIVGPLAGFMDKAFSGNRFQPGNPLRGIYLTSAPHWEDSKHLAEPSPKQSAEWSSYGTSDTGKMRGQPRFIHGVLTRIIFPEAGLAVLNQKEIRRMHWQQLAMGCAAAGCIGLFATMWAKGFSQNDERITHLNQLGEQLAQDRLQHSTQDTAFAVLPQLESGHAALQLFVMPAPSPLGHLLELDQGRATRPVLLDAYQHELESQLMPRIARQLANRLRGNLNNRDQLLNSLRAYLMLDDVQHRDVDFLTALITHQWREGYAGTPADQQKLGSHLSRLFHKPVRIRLDEALIEQARQALRNTPVAELAYQALKDKARNLPDYHLNRQADPYSAVFSAGEQAIPGLYTKKNYQRYFLAQGIALVQESLREDWVMGLERQLEIGSLKTLMVELEQLYLRDYADHWSQAIGQLARVPLDTMAQGAEQAALLTAANSPLIKVLVQVRENTRFEAPEVDGDEQTQPPASKPSTLARMALLEPLPNNGRIALQRRFAAFHQLLNEDNTPTLELAATLQALNNLHLQLATVARSSQPEQAAFDLSKSRMGGQLDAISMIHTASKRLPQPFSDWGSTLADDSWRLLLDDTYRYINQRYQRELYSVYRQALAQRYPFTASSESDVALADFREFFKAQGLAERFFEDHLKPFIKGDGNHYRLRAVDGRSLPISGHTLAQISHVQTIRRSFFSEDPEQPQFKFRLEPYSLDQNLSRADFRFGDKQLEYRHGPIVPLAMHWPAETDSAIASIIVEHPGGRRVGYRENTGPWSLFRLIERLETDYHSGRDVLMLKANLEERNVNYLLMSQRSPNPFEMGDLRAFKLPAVL